MNPNINTIKILAAEAVQKANSGHPGLPLGAAPMTYVLWDKVMKHNPSNPYWLNRDRFVLSAGHGSALLYTMLHLYGYPVSLDDLKAFRQVNSKTPGHPEYGHTVGVETTTGPLGQGFANGVGMALAERYMSNTFNTEDIKLIDHYTYVIVGDGCLMEGISYEAASFAGTQGLNKLIVLYDSNKITIEGSTDIAFTENVKLRFEAMNWEVIEVRNGKNEEDLQRAMEDAKHSDKPSLLIIQTIIGDGAMDKAGTHGVHGSPLGQDIISQMRDNYGMEDQAFSIKEEVKAYYDQSRKRLESYNEAWDNLYETYKVKYPDLHQKLKAYMCEPLKGLDLMSIKSEEKTMATRAASGLALNKLAELNPNMIGGSADLGPSNKSVIEGQAYTFKDNPLGRNIHFGVREHAMGAIINGLNIHGGLIAFGATFMVFSDYMKPTLRLAGLMNIPSLFVLTHDSIGVGEDGPTHQPIEHLWMLRSIPNLTVHRPADFMETMVAWHQALLEEGPHALVLSRQNLEPLEKSSEEALKGGYVVFEPEGSLDGLIIATGSEVNLAIQAAKTMVERGKNVRVVSMPSLEVFKKQDASYQASILPDLYTLAIEAGSPFGWYQYADDVIGMEGFGASGPGEQLFEHFGFTLENILSKFGL